MGRRMERYKRQWPFFRDVFSHPSPSSFISLTSHCLAVHWLAGWLVPAAAVVVPEIILFLCLPPQVSPANSATYDDDDVVFPCIRYSRCYAAAVGRPAVWPGTLALTYLPEATDMQRMCNELRHSVVCQAVI